jgi:hypothetical protein
VDITKGVSALLEHNIIGIAVVAILLNFWLVLTILKTTTPIKKFNFVLLKNFMLYSMIFVLLLGPIHWTTTYLLHKQTRDQNQIKLSLYLDEQDKKLEKLISLSKGEGKIIIPLLKENNEANRSKKNKQYTFSRDETIMLRINSEVLRSFVQSKIDKKEELDETSDKAPLDNEELERG